jgi:hypothetical protein
VEDTNTRTILCPLVCLFLWAAPVQADTFTKVWRLAELPPQDGWGPYRGGDTWPGVLGGKKEFRLTLDRPLPPGRYRIQVRTLNVPALEVGIAGQKLPVKLVRNAFSAPLDGETKAMAAALTLYGEGILQAVFITSDLTQEIGPGDVARRITPAAAPVKVRLPAPVRGNYLENSSFEVGPGHGWGKFWNDHLDDSSAADGRWSLRLPVVPHFVGGDVGWTFRLNGAAGLESKFYRLPPGK